MYTKTYIFGESTTVGFLLGTGDRFLLIVTFEINETENDVTYLAEDRGLKLAKRGETSIEFDYEEYLMAPQEYNFEIADLNGELNELLYDGPSVSKVNKRFYVEMKVKYSNKPDYEIEFSGYNVHEALEYDPLNCIHYITAIPSSDTLNVTKLYPDNYDASKWDPGQPNEHVPYNPLNLAWTRPTGGYVHWSEYYATDIITKIFQVINPAMQVQFYQDWRFAGYAGAEGMRKGVVIENQYTLFDFADIRFDGFWLGPVFGGRNHNYSNLGDLLKEIAFDFGSVAGIISGDKAYFRQIGYFDANDLQQLGKVFSYKKKYKYTNVEFCEINGVFYDRDKNQINRYFENGYKPTGRYPYVSERIGDGNNITKTVISIADHYWLSPENTGAYSTNLKAVRDGINYGILKIFPRDGINSTPYTQFLAVFHYNLRGKLYNSQVHELEVDGLNYNALQGFQQYGHNYSPVGIKKNWDNEITTIEALKVSDINVDDTSGSVNGTVITTPVNTLSMKVVPGKVGLSYAQIGQGAIPVANMDTDEWLDEFIIQVEVPFGINQITGFRLFDGTETLMTIEKVTGKFLKVVNPQAIRKVKQYTAPDTIYLEWIGGTAAPTVGQGTLIIKKMVKA